MDKVKAIKVLKPLVNSYVDHANISMKEEDDNIADALEMAVEALDVPNTNVGDMISRQAAIELCDWYDNPSLHDDLEKLPPAHPDLSEYSDKLWKSAYERGKAEAQDARWVPCSERLPNHDEYIKNNGLFIVSDGNRSYSEWYDIYDKRKFGEPTMSGFRIDYAVIAWMPLPPYSGGDVE